MRYSVSISLNSNGENLKKFDFSESYLADQLTLQSSFSCGQSVVGSFAHYERETPGLVESNWENPYFDDDDYFVFIGGYIITRNDLISQFGEVPSPKTIKAFLASNHSSLIHKKFKGNYYIIFLDKQKNVIQAFSSPLVVHPVFYTFINGVLQFSNFLGAFSEVANKNIDKRRLVEFVLFDHTLKNSTLYNNVYTCMGGEVTVFEYNQPIKRQLLYDLVNWYTQNPVSRRKALPEINEALKKSIGVYLSKTDKFNSSLTGGFDGRLNLSLIPQSRFGDIQAISYGIYGSRNINIPIDITNKLNIKHKPIYLDDEFESVYSELGLKSIFYSGGHTGFHRAMYPYAYSKMASYSRSCILGQCDMIRPLYTNPAGIVFNGPSRAVFFGTYEDFLKEAKISLDKTVIQIEDVSDDLLKEIYDEIFEHYIKAYPLLNNKLCFYFYLYKEGLVKFWQTEFHLVDLFIDDYVSFADLDYLELLFSSKYAGIYKGLLADNQVSRRRGQDLYVDLMTLNNNRLNSFFVDRGYKPKWLKFGFLGWAFSGGIKIIKSKLKKEKDDTFRSKKWTEQWLNVNRQMVLQSNNLFDTKKIEQKMESVPCGNELHTFVRALSLKIWLDSRS